jgi:hypothetical protein
MSKTVTSQAINLQPEPDGQANAEHHLSTNINLGWQKLEHYYQKLDDTPIYVAAVISHLINQSVDEKLAVLPILIAS